MLSPATFNFDGSDPLHPYVYVGQTFNPLFTAYVDFAQTEPFDLTGYAATMVVAGVITLVSGTDGLVLGGTFGTVAPFISDTVTSEFPAGFATHYYLQLVDSDGVIGYALRGSMVWAAP